MGRWLAYLSGQGRGHKVGIAEGLGLGEAGGSGKGMRVGGCGEWRCGMVMDGGNAES